MKTSHLQKEDKGKNKRMTKQRRVIKEILCSTKSHPTADWIYEEARKVLPDISLGTVYRNLQVLLSEDNIQELNYGKGYSRFDGNPRPHYHFVCKQCGRVYDVEMPLADFLTEAAAQATGGIVESHRLEFAGICRDCRQEAGKAQH